MREAPDPKLAAILKQLREERRLTQEELAFKIELTASGLSRIERGRSNPIWTTVRQIAEALDVSIEEIARLIHE